MNEPGLDELVSPSSVFDGDKIEFNLDEPNGPSAMDRETFGPLIA